MARITEIFLVETPPQDAVVVHSPVTGADIPTFIMNSLTMLEEYARYHKVNPADAPFLRITGSSAETAVITAGLPLPSPLGSSGAIEGSVIEAGKKLFCYYLGNGEEAEAVYAEMREFAEKRGLKVKDGLYEYYLNGLEHGKDKLLTKIIVLLEDSAKND